MLNPEIQLFINDNIDVTIEKLALQKNPFPETGWISILNQIEAKTKAKEKLPTWFNSKNILYPAKISIEQTSSEKTALYKSSIVSGESLIDLTGGFGIDAYYFAKKTNKVIHCEINNELSNIVKHNFKVLNCTNIECFSGDSLEIVTKLEHQWDWIYIDPSRRNDVKGKVFMLKDCLPNVPVNLAFYFKHSTKILIKTAPILDIRSGLIELKNVKTVHIIALENEVKELLWEIHKDFNEPITLKTANILKDKIEVFEFILDENKKTPTYNLPCNYLYEPNSAIMKSGGFEEVATQFNLDKLHKHSHLYTSNALIDFPGRIFKIEKTIPYTKSEMKLNLENSKANISIRNFPETVENIRKKWKIKEGGNTYCFFSTVEKNDKIVLICSKIK